MLKWEGVGITGFDGAASLRKPCLSTLIFFLIFYHDREKLLLACLALFLIIMFVETQDGDCTFAR